MPKPTAEFAQEKSSNLHTHTQKAESAQNKWNLHKKVESAHIESRMFTMLLEFIKFM